MTFNLMIAGVGGQGTVLASKLISAAAMKKGFDVRTTETIGMAQRGGSVFGHCRIGENIFSPLIPLGKADALIAFEPSEAVRQLAYIQKNSTVLVCDKVMSPVNSSYELKEMIDYLKKNAPKLIMIDSQRLANQNPKTLNVTLLGAAAQSGIFPFDAQTLKEVLPEILPQRLLEMNYRALELGREVIINS
ncbi:MAG: indolepyruvate oxidoreductase subunit beta [Treponema sp.]|nr:indolepyruvate oxidoreductase subunit beta [Treponema sp.]MCL2251063.1 indolepyruvate oxidoreductase subunit beta [Treponema sp.]